jgi:hypothetical protein
MVAGISIVASRNYPFIDSMSLQEGYARDVLLRFKQNMFLLYMTSSSSEERLLWFDVRSALNWLNASPDDFGLEWA